MLYPDNGVAVAPSMRVLMFAASSLLYFIYKDEQSCSMQGFMQLCSKLVVYEVHNEYKMQNHAT